MSADKKLAGWWTGADTGCSKISVADPVGSLYFWASDLDPHFQNWGDSDEQHYIKPNMTILVLGIVIKIRFIKMIEEFFCSIQLIFKSNLFVP